MAASEKNFMSYYHEDSSEEEASPPLKRKFASSDEDEIVNKKRLRESWTHFNRNNSDGLSSNEEADHASLYNSEDNDAEVRFDSQEENSDNYVEQQNRSEFSSNAQKIMMSMGYKEGKGLGKFGQGIVDPIAASQQRGRRGLGFTIRGLEPMENLTWDKSQEYTEVQEEVMWLPQNTDPVPDLHTLLSWVREGTKLKDISEQTEFCYPHILKQILASKNVFDDLPEKEMYKARSRSNPFETLGKLFFQNRAALKMANMDAVFDFMFTKPVDENGKTLIAPHELLYFADVCAAPGGFSEYMLWRRKDINGGFCDAKGFGFTLRENDFKLDDFFAAPPEFFEPHYGVNGNNGDGDIYVPGNISNFRAFVLKSTEGKGVHAMLADGGFSVEGQENIQEILSKRLYLCQFLVALGIVRSGGHFVCKLFDIFTPFSIGLVYIMYKCFKRVSIHKPNTSRPANSERYIICKWRKENVEDAYEFLFKINCQLDSFGSTSVSDIVELVPLELLKADEPFYEYICETNNVFGGRQVIGLQKIRAFAQDLSLIEDQQATLRKECLNFWSLPDKPRVAPIRMDPERKAYDLLSKQKLDQLGKNYPDLLCVENLIERIHSPFDFRFVFLASQKDSVRERGFFLGLGGPNVYVWSGRDTASWQRVEGLISLPADTIIYGELATELRGELKAQRKVRTLHCIDALILNGFDVTCLHLVERHNHLKKFSVAVNKESRNDLITIRCKPLYKLEEIASVMRPPVIDWRMMKGGSSMYKRVYREAEATDEDPVRYTIPTGIMLIKITEDPWMMAFSRSKNRKYFFNTQTREATYDCQKEFIAQASTSYSKGSFWWWNHGVRILDSEPADDDSVHLSSLICHINKPM